MSLPLPRVLFVAGPSASGKSCLAAILAETLGGEIINCDAMQMYAGLPIITNQPTPQETRGVPHHLFSCLASTAAANVHDYVSLAAEAIAGVVARGRLPIVCGGTLFYMLLLLLDHSTPVPNGQGMEEEHGEDVVEELAYLEGDARKPASASSLQQRRERVEGRVPRFDSLLLWLQTERSVLEEKVVRRSRDIMHTALREAETFMTVINSQPLPSASTGERDYQCHLHQALGLREVLAGDVLALTRHTLRYCREQERYFDSKLAPVVGPDRTVVLCGADVEAAESAVREWLSERQQRVWGPYSVFSLPDHFRCELCGVVVCGAAEYRQHITGRRHRRLKKRKQRQR